MIGECCIHTKKKPCAVTSAGKFINEICSLHWIDKVFLVIGLSYIRVSQLYHNEMHNAHTETDVERIHFVFRCSAQNIVGHIKNELDRWCGVVMQ